MSISSNVYINHAVLKRPLAQWVQVKSFNMCPLQLQYTTIKDIRRHIFEERRFFKNNTKNGLLSCHSFNTCVIRTGCSTPHRFRLINVLYRFFGAERSPGVPSFLLINGQLLHIRSIGIMLSANLRGFFQGTVIFVERRIRDGKLQYWDCQWAGCTSSRLGICMSSWYFLTWCVYTYIHISW